MEFPQRKQPRLRDYDYSRAGAYFLTLCAKDKACIFSQVEAGAAVGRGVPDAPLLISYSPLFVIPPGP